MISLSLSHVPAKMMMNGIQFTGDDVLFPGFHGEINLNQMTFGKFDYDQHFFGFTDETTETTTETIDTVPVLLCNEDSNASPPVSSPVQTDIQQQSEPIDERIQRARQRTAELKRNKARSYMERIRLTARLESQVTSLNDQMQIERQKNNSEIQRMRTNLMSVMNINRENDKTIQCLQYELAQERTIKDQLNRECIRLVNACAKLSEQTGDYGFDLQQHHHQLNKLSLDYDLLKLELNKTKEENSTTKRDYDDLLGEYNSLRADYDEQQDYKEKCEQLNEECKRLTQCNNLQQNYKRKYEQLNEECEKLKQCNYDNESEIAKLLLKTTTKAPKPLIDPATGKKRRGRPPSNPFTLQKLGIIQID